MIVVGSRYQDGHRQPILHMGRDAGTTNLAVFRDIPESGQGRSTLIFKANDRWDLVSIKAQGSSTEWWRILDVNDEIIDPFSVPAGTRVRMP